MIEVWDVNTQKVQATLKLQSCWKPKQCSCNAHSANPISMHFLIFLTSENCSQKVIELQRHHAIAMMMMMIPDDDHQWWKSLREVWMRVMPRSLQASTTTLSFVDPEGATMNFTPTWKNPKRSSICYIVTFELHHYIWITSLHLDYIVHKQFTNLAGSVHIVSEWKESIGAQSNVREVLQPIVDFFLR